MIETHLFGGLVKIEASLATAFVLLKMSDWNNIECNSCHAETEVTLITSTCQSCGEPWDNDMLTRCYTRYSAEEILDPDMKKRVMALQDIWYAKHKIHMIAAGPLLGTRQKLYDMYMNGFLRNGRSEALREQLEPCDHALFDELCTLYEDLAIAKAIVIAYS